MSPESKPRKRHASVSLVVVFALGVGIGVSLTYAYFDVMGADFSGGGGLFPAGGPAEPMGVPEGEGEETPPPAPAMEVYPGQHLALAVTGPVLDPKDAARLAQVRPGAVVLSQEHAQDAAQFAALLEAITQACAPGLPPLFLFNPAHAPEERPPFALDGLPMARELGDANDPELASRMGAQLGRAAAAWGVHGLLSPVLEPFVDGVSPPHARELTLSDDPAVSTSIGLAYMQGIMDAGCLAFAKHYPGLLSAAPRDAAPPRLAPDPEELTALAPLLFPFSEAAAQGVSGLVVAPVAVPALDVQQPDRPAVFSPVLLSSLVREEWAYDGLLIAAGLEEDAYFGEDPIEVRVVKALGAGCDMAMVGAAPLESLDRILTAVTANANDGNSVLSGGRLEDSKARLSWVRGMAGLPLEPTPEEPTEGEEITEMEDEPAVPKEGEALPEGEPSESGEGEGEAGASGTEGESETEAESGEGEDAQAEGETAREGEGEEDAAPEGEGEAGPEGEAAPLPGGEGEAGGEGEVETEGEAAASLPLEGEGEGEAAAAPSAEDGPIVQPPGTKRFEHRIRPGQSLTDIANEYGVGINDLRRWNRLSDDVIKYGQTLLVFVPVATAEEEGEPEAQAAAAESTAVSTGTYVVSPGDNLRRIAERFGTTQQWLMERNGIADPNHIELGQRLKVPSENAGDDGTEPGPAEPEGTVEGEPADGEGEALEGESAEGEALEEAALPDDGAQPTAAAEGEGEA